MKGRPAIALPATSALACLVYLRLRFVIEPASQPQAPHIPTAPGFLTTCDLLFITALFIWSIAKFVEEDEDRPLWPYALSILFCIYPLFTVVF